MILTVPGDVPSLKNSKQIFYDRRKKRHFITSSNRYKKWIAEKQGTLFTQFAGYKLSGFPITVELTFWFSRDIRHDLDNAAGGIMDLLVSEGILPDDNCNYVNKLILNYGGLDRKNPRCEIKFQD